MVDSVLISNEKENILEFDAEVRGIKDPKMSVNFVIKTDLVNLSFPAKHERGNTWSVVVPPLKLLETGKHYTYFITVDVEGYHFEPMEGEIQVVSEIKPRVTKVARKEEKKTASTKPVEKKPEPAAEEPKKQQSEEPKVEPAAKEPAKEEVKEEVVASEEVQPAPDPLEKTIERIITRETLRKSPTDMAVRKVLDEVKKAPPATPTVEEPTETPEQISQRLAEEARKAEQQAREEAVRSILKGMSGTRATIRH